MRASYAIRNKQFQPTVNGFLAPFLPVLTAWEVSDFTWESRARHTNTASENCSDRRCCRLTLRVREVDLWLKTSTKVNSKLTVHSLLIETELQFVMSSSRSSWRLHFLPVGWPMSSEWQRFAICQVVLSTCSFSATAIWFTIKFAAATTAVSHLPGLPYKTGQAASLPVTLGNARCRCCSLAINACYVRFAELIGQN